MSATAPLSAMTLPRTSARRRRTDKVMRGAVLTATIVALVPLVLVIYYLLHKGLSLWFTSGFFTSDPTGSFFGNPGGIRSAILGSLEIVALATVISIPIGIGVALYLTEYGKDSWYANTVRYFVDVMTGVPSIMFGLFIYIVLVVSDFGGSGYAAWKGAVALALLMLPIVIRSAEVVLLLVPSSLREAALALGAPRWRVIFQVVLPTSATGLVTGCLLAVARAMGETAPLLFTVSTAFGLTFSLSQQMNTMPFLIYTDITSPRTAIENIAWGTALTLVVIVLLLNLIARLIASRSRMA
jgi:phosphate transport system permease protein